MTMRAARWWATAALVTVALGLASCGGGEGTSGGPSTLRLAAVPGKIAYDKSTLEAGAGRVTIVMSNPSSLPHDVAIEDGGVDAKGEVVGRGGTSTVTANLKPGTYTFYCSVPGHRQAGMKGKLSVE